MLDMNFYSNNPQITIYNVNQSLNDRWNNNFRLMQVSLILLILLFQGNKPFGFRTKLVIMSVSNIFSETYVKH